MFPLQIQREGGPEGRDPEPGAGADKEQGFRAGAQAGEADHADQRACQEWGHNSSRNFDKKIKNLFCILVVKFGDNLIDVSYRRWSGIRTSLVQKHQIFDFFYKYYTRKYRTLSCKTRQKNLHRKVSGRIPVVVLMSSRVGDAQYKK